MFDLTEEPSFDPASPACRKRLATQVKAVATWLVVDGGRGLKGLAGLPESVFQVANDLDIAAIKLDLSSYE